jgi:regulator of RNase E activity RraA
MPAPVDPTVLAELALVETATIGHWRHLGFLHRGIQPLLRGHRVAGTAVTIAIPGPDSTLLHHALGLLRPGDILLVDRLGDDRHACWGGAVTLAAKAAGAVAGIVDGPCTDLAEIEHSGFPMWARGIAPVTTRLYDLGGYLNVPVSCGGAVVQPGDAVLADDSGVVVLPPAEVRTVVAEALERQARGAERERAVSRGAKLGDLSGASDKVRARLQQAAEERSLK